MMFKKSTQSNWHDYVEERLSAYIDGRLPDAERSLVRKHLNECDRCQDSLASLGWTIKLVKQLPAPPLPRQFTLPVPETAPRSSGFFRWGLAAATGVASFAIVLLIGLQLIRPPAAGDVAIAPAAAPLAGQTLVGMNSAPPTQPARNSAPNFEKTAPTVQAPGIQAAPPTNPALLSAPASEPTLRPAAVGTKAPRVLGAPPATLTPIPPAVPPMASKSVAPTLPCLGCGGGAESGPTPTQPATGDSGPMVALSAPPAPTVEFSQVTTGTVTAWVLNVRRGPSIRATAVGWLFRFSDVGVLGRDLTGQWLEILYQPPGGAEQTAWVDSQYVYLTVSVMDLPVISPAPVPTATPTPFGMQGGPATTTVIASPESTPEEVPTLVNQMPTETPQPIGHATVTTPTQSATTAAVPTLGAATPTLPSSLP